MLCQLAIKCNLLLGLFGNGFNDKVRIIERLIPVGSELEMRVCLFDATFEFVELLGCNILFGDKTIGICFGVGFERLKGVQINLFQTVNLGLCATD